jgi:hypothetical protein
LHYPSIDASVVLVQPYDCLQRPFFSRGSRIPNVTTRSLPRSERPGDVVSIDRSLLKEWRGVAMLHSFAYEDAIATFKDLETQESCRGMAYYGEAIVGSSSYEHWLVNKLAVSISRIAI